VRRLIVLLLAQALWTPIAFAQDSAPKEAPYIQEDNEFDAFTNELPPPEEEKDAAALEKEISKPAEKKETVDLNKESDKKLEDQLIFPEEDTSKVATPFTEPSPYVEPQIEQVQPTKKTPRSSKISKSEKGGYEYIQHPQASKGLMMITKEGAYVYRTNDKLDYKHSGSFTFSMIDAPQITSAAAGNNGSTSFRDMYSGGQQPLIGFTFEWQPFRTFGRLGLQAGFNLLMASGNGRFISDGTEAKEKYTFLAVPLNVGLSYRLEWFNRQWVAPYVAGGGTYIPVIEFRDDGKEPSKNGSPGVYGGGGLMFNISAINRETAFTLQSEYGIQNLWVTLDAKYLKTFNEDLDFSSSVLGAGITCDY
jgi:hypothetical protein